MRDKIEQGILYFIYFAVIFFGISIVLFLGNEIFGGKLLYDFLKDHGSLIAGIIGFIGIFILVWNQNKTTKKMLRSQDESTKATVEATLKAILLESSAIEKRAHKMDIVKIISCKDEMHMTMINNRGYLVYRDYQNNLYKIREVAKRLVFLIINKNNADRYKGLLFINSFFIFYDELFKLSGRAFASQIDLDVVNVNDMRINALQHLQDWREYTRDKDRDEIILNNIMCLKTEIKVIPIVDEVSSMETGQYRLSDFFLSEMSKPFHIIDMVLQDVIKSLDSEE
ncbi:hypothetical protein B9T11_07915 [Wohlfahrtiimonas chitiniclastica]|nr:hypothetical protein B9T11_07915 [Wohlfahrtiimonas chitiniclastica]